MTKETPQPSKERKRINVETVYDKGVGMINEDALVVRDHRFAVFDGASSLVPYTDQEGRTGGYIAANIAREVFENRSGSLKEAALEANKKIGEVMRKHHIDIFKKETTWCTTFAAVEIDPILNQFHWAQITDTLILLITKDGTHELLVQGDYYLDRNIMIRWKEKAERQEEHIRQSLDKEILTLRATANIKSGVLNGDSDAEKFLQTGQRSLKGVAHILLFTDGLLIPKEDPRQPDDFETFAELFLTGGLKRVKQYVRKLEDEDPKCWKYPRYKQHDDIAAVAITL